MLGRTKKSQIEKTTNMMRDVVKYAQVMAHDQRLRSDLRAALGHGSTASARLKKDIHAGNIYTRLAVDKKLRKNLRAMLDDLDHAGSRMRGRRSHRIRNAILVTVGAVGAALAFPRVRPWLEERASDILGAGSAEPEPTIWSGEWSRVPGRGSVKEPLLFPKGFSRRLEFHWTQLLPTNGTVVMIPQAGSHKAWFIRPAAIIEGRVRARRSAKRATCSPGWKAPSSLFGFGSSRRQSASKSTTSMFRSPPIGYRTDEPPKGVIWMAMGRERTKEQLYNQAKRLNIKGRSKMNKGQLKAVLARKGH